MIFTFSMEDTLTHLISYNGDYEYKDSTQRFPTCGSRKDGPIRTTGGCESYLLGNGDTVRIEANGQVYLFGIESGDWFLLTNLGKEPALFIPKIY